ncbi:MULTISPECIES: shikimate dehydrogenase [unclassified Modestobacter]|uniref:shikimate dehydrogenase n=1 Tax=unclassified Modestobacter TaxID=2643866 RepID=UPI0022AAA12C|nr:MULTISPECIES: shikimate dehydrogenase [unclassified Modestobacter]MCZ2812849.1 shikimate dehydrogenase [Modestobacter sp. VKM Ac-2979]MCZ2843122.1 shikimate dehydrogenase [Modestobacter sp. VKM Ac-2980]MCZ2847729.1 shikimate dehydrogenase [Modestobacter sp. VKM Ac-2978]
MRAAVLGRPVGHSLSPLLHRAAYAALGLDDWSYDALDVGAEDLPVLLAGLGPEWRGFSVTMPCKQAAVAVADEVDQLPRLLGAANTLLRTDAGWRAENTDVTGVGMALQLGGVERVEHAAVLGAGGTAAAAATALASLGAQQVDVVVREPARAGDLLRVLGALGVSADVQRLDRTGTLTAPVVVSTVPASGQAAVADLTWWRGQTVLDVLYAGWPTPLAQRVQAAGGRTISGLEVLFWQATAQVELMTGHPAPIEAMRAALDA